MKGLNLTTAQLMKCDNATWRSIVGGSPDRKPRAKRFTGPTAQKKQWEREQSALPGRFFTTGPIPNWLNDRMHHHKAADIHKRQNETAYYEVRAMTLPVTDIFLAGGCVVTLTRYGPKVLDDDGLAASLKYYRDGVARALGVDDGDLARVRFVPQQVLTPKAGWYGLRIEIAPALLRAEREGQHE